MRVGGEGLLQAAGNKILYLNSSLNLSVLEHFIRWYDSHRDSKKGPCQHRDNENPFPHLR